MFRKQAALFALLSVVGAYVLVAQDATPDATPDTLPDTILIASPGLMPEGIEYDPASDRLLVGSLAQGTIHAVAADGSVTPIIESENLASSVGIQVDAATNRLLVAVTNRTMRQAALGSYDLETGEELFFVDLAGLLPSAGGGFANDVAVDADGNAYVTDSTNGVFYKVDADGTASVFLQDASLAGRFTLNGVTYHPNGYLLATHPSGLIRIPLDAPEAFTSVASDDFLGGGDGIVLLDDNTLVLVSGQLNKVVRITSEDDFETAAITGEFSTLRITATTAAVRDGEVYVVYADFSHPNATEYPIQRVIFTEPAS